MLTPVFNHLLCFHFVCCAKKVSELINHPVVCLFGTRVGGTRVKVVTKSVYLKLPTTREFSGITGIRAPMEVEKNVCERLQTRLHLYGET